MKNLILLSVLIFSGCLAPDAGITGSAVDDAKKNCESHGGLKDIGQHFFPGKLQPSNQYEADCNDGLRIIGDVTTYR